MKYIFNHLNQGMKFWGLFLNETINQAENECALTINPINNVSFASEKCHFKSNLEIFLSHQRFQSLEHTYALIVKTMESLSTQMTCSNEFYMMEK